MNKRAFEFYARNHVHQRVVKSMDNEPVGYVTINSVNSWAVTLETNAPIDKNSIQGHGESTKPER